MSRQTTAIVQVGRRDTGPRADRPFQPPHVVRFPDNSVLGWQVHPLSGPTGDENEPTLVGTTAALHGSPCLAHEPLLVIDAHPVQDAATLTRDVVASTAAAQPCQLGSTRSNPDACCSVTAPLTKFRGWGIEADLMTAQSASAKAAA